MKRLLIAAALSLGIGLFAASDSQAVHKGAGDLTCGQCHTMHNSQGGASLGGNSGGSLILLRGAVTTRADIHNFCFQCHASDGAQAAVAFSPHSNSAPKILLDSVNITAKWDQATAFSRIGSGGDFQYACGNAVSGVWTCTDNGVALGKGHSLGATAVTPPGGDAAIAEFTCTNCHDPHGTDSATNATINKFRNLRKVPTGSGTITGGGGTLDVSTGANGHKSWVGGITGTFGGGGNFLPALQSTGVAVTVPTAANNTIWPIFRGATLSGTATTDATNSNAYGGGATGLAAWCTTCHDNWHENGAGTTNSSGADWRRHPVDNVLQDTSPTSGDGVTIFDPTNYLASAAGQVLPVVSASATNRVFYMTTATTDKVFCFSCHFVHGGPYNDNLRWDYTSSVSSGAQTGNGVPSNRGCQLCHNRGG